MSREHEAKAHSDLVCVAYRGRNIRLKAVQLQSAGMEAQATLVRFDP